jgi:tripartite-type tricarboxylate transporter receptor subunit TctC
VINLGLSKDPHFPQLKNTVDLGNPFSCTSDYGMIVPAGTPEPIRAKLEKALKEVLEDPGVKETLFKMGLNRQFQTGKEYRVVVVKMVESIPKLAEFVKDVQ